MRRPVRTAVVVAMLVAGAAATLTCPAASQPSGVPPSRSTASKSFRAFLDGLWPEAQAAGASRPVFDAAFDGLDVPDPRVLARAKQQSEFSRPIGEYVEGAASPDRVARGLVLAASWGPTLTTIEARTGVPPSIILAIWAVESGFGSAPGGFDVVRSLATLAVSGERSRAFRAELVDALVIMETEKLARAQMTGSWAGAMGQTQFMPSSFLAHAVDGDGDGRRDIWTSVPDVLASIGGFLADAGWQRGERWGEEVMLPADLNLAIARRSFDDWRRAGLVRGDGVALSGTGEASLYFPAGLAGPAFLLGENFEAIRQYNTSDSYALGVGLLADRIVGSGPLRRDWPKAPVLSLPDRRRVHVLLAALGLYAGAQDGKFGAQTREAVRRFQAAHGIPADGYADREVLERLNQAVGPDRKP